MNKRKKISKKTIWSILLAVVLIGYIGYNFIDLVALSKEKGEWTEKQKNDLFEQTRLEIINAVPEYSDYDLIIDEYCNCIVENLCKNYSYDDYYKISKLPEEDKTQTLTPILQQCNDSFIEQIKFKRGINSCAKRAMEKGNIDSLQAIEYCECFLTYLKDKYGKLESINMDSIKVNEKVQIEKCLKEAIK